MKTAGNVLLGFLLGFFVSYAFYGKITPAGKVFLIRNDKTHGIFACINEFDEYGNPIERRSPK